MGQKVPHHDRSALRLIPVMEIAVGSHEEKDWNYVLHSGCSVVREYLLNAQNFKQQPL